VIARADDSSGIIGDACRRLLDLHPQSAAAAGVAPTKLVDWMVKFQFDGDVDYFELDPVAYAPALGDAGMRAYRVRLDTIRSTLTPEPMEADRWSVPDRHERWVLEWNDRRLAVLDRDVDAIVRTHARDRKVAAWLQDTAKAFEEIGEIDLAIDWARRAADHHPDHQALQAADYWCELLARHRPAELVITRHLVFSRWPSATTAARLHRDAGRSWPDYRDEVLNALATKPEQAVLFALHTLKDPRLAWDQAAALREDDDHTWAEVAEAYEPIDPLAVLPIQSTARRARAGLRWRAALPACSPAPGEDAQARRRYRPGRCCRHVHRRTARHAPATPAAAARVRPGATALNPRAGHPPGARVR